MMAAAHQATRPETAKKMAAVVLITSASTCLSALMMRRSSSSSTPRTASRMMPEPGAEVAAVDRARPARSPSRIGLGTPRSPWRWLTYRLMRVCAASRAQAPKMRYGIRRLEHRFAGDQQQDPARSPPTMATGTQLSDQRRCGRGGPRAAPRRRRGSPGHSATVLVTLAVTAGRPTATSAGKLIRVPAAGDGVDQPGRHRRHHEQADAGAADVVGEDRRHRTGRRAVRGACEVASGPGTGHSSCCAGPSEPHSGGRVSGTDLAHSAPCLGCSSSTTRRRRRTHAMLDSVLSGATDPSIEGVEVVNRPALVGIGGRRARGRRLRARARRPTSATCRAPSSTSSISSTTRASSRPGAGPTGCTCTATTTPTARLAAIEKIVTGLQWRRAAAPVTVIGEPSADDLAAVLGARCRRWPPASRSI